MIQEAPQPADGKKVTQPADSTHEKVATNQLVDPGKLFSDSVGASTLLITAARKTDWSTPAVTSSLPSRGQKLDSFLTFDNTIYGSCTLDNNFNLNNIGTPSKFPSNSLSWASSYNIDTFNNIDYAKNYWTTDYSTQLGAKADTTLGLIFDDKGDADKLKLWKAPEADAGFKAQMDAHKSGETWSENGVSYYKTDQGDLVRKDANGVHFAGADGLRFDASRGEATFSKNGETVVKKGHDYFKKYPDGEEVQITEKGDIEAIVKLEGMVFEQRKAALAKMDPAALAEARTHGSRTVTGPDGVQIFKVDKDGDLVAKSSKEAGAFVRTRGGDVYHVKDGKVYKVVNHTEQEVSGEQIPSLIKRGDDDSLKIGSVTLTRDNQYIDSDHNQNMEDMRARVSANTTKGPVIAEAVDGKETLKTADHKYQFDPSNGGKYAILKPDNSVDLTFDNRTQRLSTDGVIFTPDGCQIGNNFIGYDGSFIAGTRVIFSSDSSYSSYANQDSVDEKVSDSVDDARQELGDVSGDLANYSADFGDVADLRDNLSLLSSLQGLNLSESARAKVSSSMSSVSGALSNALRQAEAASLAHRLTGAQSSQLVKEIVDAGGSPAAAEEIMLRAGLVKV
jgi:hypothetical protein